MLLVDRISRVRLDDTLRWAHNLVVERFYMDYYLVGKVTLKLVEWSTWHFHGVKWTTAVCLMSLGVLKYGVCCI